MEVGLLWFDDDPQRRLEEKVLRAAMHYERKYGQPPNLCFVHPSVFNGNGNGKRDKKSGVKRARSGDLAQRLGDFAQLEIRPGRCVLRDHFWLGVDPVLAVQDKCEDRSRVAGRK